VCYDLAKCSLYNINIPVCYDLATCSLCYNNVLVCYDDIYTSRV